MNTENTPIDRAITEKEAAEILGLARMTLRQLRCRGSRSADIPELPFYRYSARCIRYSLADVLAWKEARKVEFKAKVA